MTFKIAVLVKQVPDLEARVQIAADGGLDIENRFVCSFFDEIAVEQALELKKAYPEVELVALSAGGRRAVEALRRAVAMGIDTVEQIGDDSLLAADTYYIAAVLAARLKQIGPQLVLCGKQAGDDDQAAVGPMVAEILGLPHASAVVSMAVDPATASAVLKRKVEGGVCTVRTSLPALATAEKGLTEPHLPVVTRVMKAMKAKIENIALSSLGLSDLSPEGRLKGLGFAPPPTRPPVTMVDNVAALVEHLTRDGLIS